jgi:hypothetical protein
MYIRGLLFPLANTIKYNLPNCLKRAETDVVLSVLDVRAYIVSFLSSLDMNQVPEKLYLGQNVMKEQRSAYKSYIEKIILNLLLNHPDQNISNQFKLKKLLFIKILRYRQNRCRTNEERWTDHS